MASQFPPKKNTAFTLYFTLYKNDGTVIANPGTYTKKVSIDGAAIADITASVTEEDTTYGQLSVVLSADEMNGDAIWVQIKDDTAGCVPYTAVLYTAANLMDAIKTDTAAILADTGTDGVVLKAAGLDADAVDEILDEVVEGSVTLRQAVRLILSALTGKVSGAGTTTVVFRDIGDTKDRISATVDASGNRTAVGTRDGS